ncbi:hypothetical protein [Microbacterium sp.]
MSTIKTKTPEKLDAAITRANDMVLGASMAIMDTDSSQAQQDQGRYFQRLFSGISDVLQEAHSNYWLPGQAPDDWESFESSQNVLRLARAVLGEDAD